MAQEDKDLEKIKELIDIMKENDLIEVELKHGDDKILLKRSGPQQPGVTSVPLAGAGIPVASAPAAGDVSQGHQAEAAPSAAKQQDDLVDIKSPIVGTFYAQPNPDSEPYVEAGSHVEPNTVVCTVEAMKVMNEIKAESNGTIVEILVKNGQAVEYGQVLFRVKPD